MDLNLANKLKSLPIEPGIYFHKNSNGEIIYIGKAAILKNRVRQYFQKNHSKDSKTEALIKEIADIDWITVETELDALFLEAEMVRRYMPAYNILLRDDKSQEYIRIDYSSAHPTVGTVRRPLDDGAEYFGPYINGFAVRRALKYLRRAFPYSTKKSIGQKRVNLHYHLGLDPGLEEGRTSLPEYRANLKKLMQYLKGERVAITKELEREMKAAAKLQNFELATTYRNQLFALKQITKQIIFSDQEFMDISKDQGLNSLADLLNLKKIPSRIECFDISHMQGTDTAASMVVFSNGLPDKTQYRKFKMRLLGNDDFGHINEVITRRHSSKNLAKWPKADLIVIDGGKGQLSAASEALLKANIDVFAIGLAKKDEEIVLSKKIVNDSARWQTIITKAKKSQAKITESDDYLLIELPKNSHIVKLLQRLRDETHRFAVSYHTSIKRSRQTTSILDELPGVGQVTKKKLLRKFGSLRGVKEASCEELCQLLGKTKGRSIYNNLQAINK